VITGCATIVSRISAAESQPDPPDCAQLLFISLIAPRVQIDPERIGQNSSRRPQQALWAFPAQAQQFVKSRAELVVGEPSAWQFVTERP
jgi:hypothetical protein